jgi:transcriptional regulator with XRE-family HTH domain
MLLHMIHFFSILCGQEVPMTQQEWRILGTRLRQVRRRLDLTSQQLAEKAGTTRVTISALENTRKPGVSFDVVARIATVLGISLDYLAGRKDSDTIALPAA